MTYTPRRMPKRYLEGAPGGVLDIIDNPEFFDRYTVFYRFVETDRGVDNLYYRGMSTHPYAPNGFGIIGEMTRWDAASYRERNRRNRVSWEDLPEDVQRCAISDCEGFDNA